MNKSEKKSFWATVPGVLTGIATIISAIAGLIIAFNSNDSHNNESFVMESYEPVTKDEVTVAGNSYQNWPLVANESFMTIKDGWNKGSFSDKNTEWFYLGAENNKYRWDLKFTNAWERWIEAPYIPSTDFYVAVDVRFASYSSKNVSANILFGRNSEKDYKFCISPAQTYGLFVWDGQQSKTLINWTYTDFDPNATNRIAVLVENQKIKLYLNSDLLMNYEQPYFTGGKVGLSISGFEASTIVSEFDNFEYRKKSN